MNCYCCKYSQIEEGDGPEGVRIECRYNPPQVLTIPVPAPANVIGPGQQRQMTFTQISYWPEVKRDHWCGKAEEVGGDS